MNKKNGKKPKRIPSFGELRIGQKFTVVRNAHSCVLKKTSSASAQAQNGDYLAILPHEDVEAI